jgi:Tfp pilus assembly protein PilN
VKAVNLIPAEERRGGQGPLAGASGATLGLLGALVLALIVVVAYVSLANGVADRRDDVADARGRADAAEQQAAALKPYGDVAALRDSTLAAVTQLAAGRFDWPALMGDLSRRVPADVTLTAVGGSSSVDADAVAAAAATPGTTVALGPAIDVSGCTGDHRAVARLMDRLAAIRGVSDVSLASSTRGEAGVGKGGCPRRDQFDLTLAMGAAE